MRSLCTRPATQGARLGRWTSPLTTRASSSKLPSGTRLSMARSTSPSARDRAGRWALARKRVAHFLRQRASIECAPPPSVLDAHTPVASGWLMASHAHGQGHAHARDKHMHRQRHMCMHPADQQDPGYGGVWQSDDKHHLRCRADGRRLLAFPLCIRNLHLDLRSDQCACRAPRIGREA